MLSKSLSSSAIDMVPLAHRAELTQNPTEQIQVAAPDLRGNEEKYVLEAIRSTWISSTGPFVQRFEREFARLCGTRSAIAVCNGTVALHLALLALDVRPGDEVLVPSLTYVATANAVRYVGAEPVFVDVDPETWCLDPLRLEASITRRTRGIIAVHLYGHPADMDAINQIAAVHGLWVVEDAAEAHLARYKGKPTGRLAQLATFSFYGNKILTSGEGGAITVNDRQLETRIRTLRGQGMDPNRRYFFPVTGYNFRLTNLACAILCAQIERRREIVERRREIYASYRTRLDRIPGIGFQPVASWADPAPWLFCITVDREEYGRSRDELAAFLAERGIETRPFFIPLHRLPPFRKESQARSEHLPVTERLSAAGLNLPTHSALSQCDLDRVAEAIRKGRRLRPVLSPRVPPALTIHQLSPEWEKPLAEFFQLLRRTGDTRRFHPHPLTAAKAAELVNYSGHDLYYVMVEEGRVLGYGLLRGWDEGYEVPSLGIALTPDVRGLGIGRTFMQFLHMAARRKGATRVRLKVHLDNRSAVGLYQTMGYKFEGEEDGQLVGYADLGLGSANGHAARH
jgi:perosamine synthetase